MPSNPSRAAQGGDVPGETKTDVEWCVGAPISVSRASYDPGYDISRSMRAIGIWQMQPADLLRGYCEQPACIGEEDPVR
jgi:hypothetical protein